MQMSFTSGELSPLLHARVDLARYATGLSELKNMIVLPQGGVTRRSGFENLGTRLDSHVKLIPFEYNTTDSVMLEFGNYAGRVWSGGSVVATFSTPYSYDEIGSLRYVQSGNTIFLAHRNHKPQRLVRHSTLLWNDFMEHQIRLVMI